MAEAASTPMATPTAATSIDTGSLREHIGMMHMTFGFLEQTLRSINDHSTRISKMGPTPKDAEDKLAELRGQFDEHKTTQDGHMARIEAALPVKAKEEAEKALGDQIRHQIKLQLDEQIKELVAQQLRAEYLPVPLATHVEESAKQVSEVQNALSNSEARRANAALCTPQNVGDPVAPVLKPDGKPSELFPTNLRSLFGYTEEQARKLAADFGLPDLGTTELNLNRFMEHIGAGIRLVPMPQITTSPGGTRNIKTELVPHPAKSAS